MAVIGLVLDPLGVEQEKADWMGLIASVSGFFSALCSGYVVDHLPFGLKLPLVLVTAGAGFGYGWLALLGLGILPVLLGERTCPFLARCFEHKGNASVRRTHPGFSDHRCHLLQRQYPHLPGASLRPGLPR